MKPEWEDDLNFTSKEFNGKMIQDIFPEEVASKLNEGIGQVSSSRKQIRVEYSLEINGLPRCNIVEEHGKQTGKILNF